MLMRCLATLLVALLVTPQSNAAQSTETKVTVSVGNKGEAFIIDATVDVPVAPRMAWEVMTDFDHMPAFLGNLKSSRVMSRNGNTWIVDQQGVARFGLLSFAFASEREIRLEPMTRILARQVTGTAKSMQSEAQIIPVQAGAQIQYHAETVVESTLARLFGASFLRHEVEEQFVGMGREMLRRQAGAEPATVTAAGPPDVR
jgi:ribosome-associated toxin RatA of RatAB toxin-antitoxin module